MSSAIVFLDLFFIYSFFVFLDSENEENNAYADIPFFHYLKINFYFCVVFYHFLVFF